MICKRIVWCGIFILLSLNANADSWAGEDKKLHAVGGFFAGGFGYMVADINKPEWRERDKFLVGVATATVIGIGKEVYDYYDYGVFSYKDVVVTGILGGAIGAYTGVSVVWIDSKLSVSRTWRW